MQKRVVDTRAVHHPGLAGSQHHLGLARNPLITEEEKQSIALSQHIMMIITIILPKLLGIWDHGIDIS